MSPTIDPGESARRELDPHPAGRRGLNYQPVNWLLLIPLVGTLLPMFYNFTSPSLGGIPFFYWYQLAWVPVTAVLLWIVFRSTRQER